MYARVCAREEFRYSYQTINDHLGMGASSPKMRIEKRKSAASVSFRLGGAFVRK